MSENTETKRTWNYRLVHYKPTDDEDCFGLHEIHYEDGVPVTRTVNPASFVGETREEVIRAMEMALDAIKNGPILEDTF